MNYGGIRWAGESCNSVEAPLYAMLAEAFRHDAWGNLLTDEDFEAADNTEYFDYAYDADNRLSRVRYDDGSGLDTQAEYVYDAPGP